MLKPGVRIYGGFIGNETLKTQRDWYQYLTILSGQVGDPLNDSDNALHVVSAFGSFNAYAKLDGFTITKGFTRGGVQTGVYSSDFINDGSAIHCSGLVKAIFQNLNLKANYSLGSTVHFKGQSSSNQLGPDSYYMVNCRSELDNTSSFRYFIRGEDASVSLYNCLFKLSPSVGVGNGDAIESFPGMLDIRNCAFVGQYAHNSFYSVDLRTSPSHIANSLSTELVRGVSGRFANIILYPWQANAWDTTRFALETRAWAPYLVHDTLDYRPKVGYFGINKGDSLLLPIDVLDLDEDGNTTERIDFDIDMNPRIQGSQVDIGPYEHYYGYMDSSYQETCIGDSVFWGATWHQGPGIYRSNFHRGSRGDSLHKLFVSHDSILTTVTPSPWGDSFTSDEADSGSIYQWIDCFFKNPIPGATGRSFVPTENGRYQVVITNRTGCVDTSECVNLPNIGLSEQDAARFSLYPNPGTDFIKVAVPSSYPEAKIPYALQSANGQQLASGILIRPDALSINIAKLKPGLYILSLNGVAYRFAKE
jgi:hypothetical protein